MSTNTARKTVAGAYAEISTLRTEIAALNTTSARILALLESSAPAVVTPAAKAPAKKTTRKPAKKATTPKVTKGAQTREALPRKVWNKTLTTKARLAGKLYGGQSVYSAVIADWGFVQEQREAGMTPDQVLEFFVA